MEIIVSCSPVLSVLYSKTNDDCEPFVWSEIQEKQLTWDEQCESAFEKFLEYLTQEPVVLNTKSGRVPLYVCVLEECSSAGAKV